MKLRKLGLAIGAVALGLCLQPNIGWTTRVYAAVITGTVTAVSSGTIDVDHHSYQVKANSAAAKALSSFYVGEKVDMVMDGPPGGTAVISIAQHLGS